MEKDNLAKGTNHIVSPFSFLIICASIRLRE